MFSVSGAVGMQGSAWFQVSRSLARRTPRDPGLQKSHPSGLSIQAWHEKNTEPTEPADENERIRIITFSAARRPLKQVDLCWLARLYMSALNVF